MKKADYNAIVQSALTGDASAVRREATRIFNSTPLTYNEYEGEYYNGRDALLTILGAVRSNRYHGELSREVEAIIEEGLEPWI